MMEDSSSRSEAEIRMMIMDTTPMDMDNLSRLEDFDESLLVELRSVKDIFSAVMEKKAERKIPMLLMLLLMLEFKSNSMLALPLKMYPGGDHEQTSALICQSTW